MITPHPTPLSYFNPTHVRSLGSADQLLLKVPKSRHKLRGDSASLSTPKMWNKLLLRVRQDSSLPF